VNRALRAATMGALLLTPVVLSACSAGQVNQTSSQERAKVGPSVEVGDITLRQVAVVHPCEAGDEDATAYESGDAPELMLTIVNSGREDDTLTGIEGELFDGVYVDELPSATPTPSVPAAPPTPATPSTSAPGTATPGADEPTTSGAPATSSVPAPVTPPAAARPTATDSPDIAIPAESSITIGLRQYEEGSPCEPEVAADTTRLFLADLDVDADAPLTPSQTVVVTFTFENAGEVTVPALVSGPHGELERGEGFDFHEEEGAEAGNEQDTEAE
jgi:copper(I)-binding protein